MSGHSKWSTIKRKKGATDAKRGQLFTRLAREIVMAAREGGGDPEMNFRLRIAIDHARANNMPKEGIERAIKRGTGESKDGSTIEQIYYEGYGPKGIAFMIDTLTENRNRTVAELRHILTKLGGSMGEAGSVAWQFTKVAFFEVDDNKYDFDKVFEIAVEGGADDVTQDEDSIEIIAPIEKFKVLSDALRSANIIPQDAGLRMVPNQEIALGAEDTVQVLRAIEQVEDLDDVQNVYSNLSITEEAMSVIEAE